MQKITLPQLMMMKQTKEPIVSLTAYDSTLARIISENGVELILVGDSLGVLISGYDTTVPVTMDQMIYHTQCVARGNQGALIMGDMPFMSYYNLNSALLNAAKLMRAGAEIVKLEGGKTIADIVYRMHQNGIPTCGHLGLTPQNVYIEGYKIRDEKNANHTIVEEAKILEEAGIQMLILKCVHHALAKQVRDAVGIPVIGIGAGPHCDGQILILYDLLGVNPEQSMLLNPSLAVTKTLPKKHFRDFLQGNKKGIAGAIQDFVKAVKNHDFPNQNETY